MTAPFRLGLVGAGAIARAYAAAMAGGTAARLVAVADTNAEAATALAADCGARVFGTHGDLVGAGLCDGVIVTTPPATHAGIAIDILSAGLPVLCEKPMSVDMEGAGRMARAASQSGALLSMASKFRFCDDLIQARAMVAEGLIGTPLILENCFTGLVDMAQRWNSDPAVSGGGVLIDNGTHSADITRWFLGPITEVLAVAGPRLQPITVEDSVTLIARTASGAQAHVETAWSYHKDRAAFLTLIGSAGAVEVGWRGSRLRRTPTGPWEPFGQGYDKVAAFAGQIAHFAAAVRGLEPARPDLEDALASVAVIQAAYRSMASGSWQPVDAAAPRRMLEAVG